VLDVLFIDADAAARTGIASRLESHGHRVRVAENGAEASAILGLEAFDVVIADLRTRGVDGLTLFRRIRRDQPNTDVIITTASATIPDALHCLAEGAADYIVKPFEAEDIEDRLARIELRRLHANTGTHSNTDDLLDGKLGRSTVLQIDADPESQKLVARYLGEDGVIHCAVASAKSLAEGLEFLKKQQFLAVLVDLHLPDAKDLDGIKRVQNLAGSTPIIALSRSDDESLALSAVQLGAQDYLIKPELDAPTLRRALRYAIERKRAEQRLVQMANYDELTGLLNRSMFRDRLAQARARTRRDQSLLGMMFLDLDRLKSVNEKYGRGAGDAMLQEVGRRLRSAVREHDTVARVGGDEFAVLLEDLATKHEATRVAERILGVLSKPIPFNGSALEIGTSIGIAVSPEDNGSTTGDLFRSADSAMFEAKRHGRNRYSVYGEREAEEKHERMQAELRRALDHKEFLLHYQPLYSFQKNAIVGCEALLRWRKPNGTLVLPTDFIWALETSGLIVDVGEVVLDTACKQLRTWRDAGVAYDRIGVNLSAVQFEQDRLPENIVEALSRAGLEAEALEVEITESLLMRDTAKTKSTVQALKDRGVRIAIDDFGTGYSSLAYLHRFPVDTLKIDRTFVEQIGTNHHGSAIVGAIIGLAHKLGIEVVAEGVETEAQVSFLYNEGCDIIQGFLSGRPAAP
jgi:diguanylate cyclase (GGDEF)-like protein